MAPAAQHLAAQFMQPQLQRWGMVEMIAIGGNDLAAIAFGFRSSS
jgi:hypothetical protein